MTDVVCVRGSLTSSQSFILLTRVVSRCLSPLVSEAVAALALEARLALVLRLLRRRQPARLGVRVEVDGRREVVGAFGVVVVVEVVLEHRLAFGSKRRSNPMRLFERDRKRFEHRDERERS